MEDIIFGTLREYLADLPMKYDTYKVCAALPIDGSEMKAIVPIESVEISECGEKIIINIPKIIPYKLKGVD